MPVSKKIHFYIDSEWEFKPPAVRIWIDNLLVSERGVTPKRQEEKYLDETLVVFLEPGSHKIVVENIKTVLAEIILHSILVDGEHLDFENFSNERYEAILTV